MEILVLPIKCMFRFPVTPQHLTLANTLPQYGMHTLVRRSERCACDGLVMRDTVIRYVSDGTLKHVMCYVSCRLKALHQFSAAAYRVGIRNCPYNRLKTPSSLVGG